MSLESPREKKGGVAYDIILKAAAGDAPPQRPTSPTKPTGRPLSQEVIEQKLKGAEERRQSREAAKLQTVNKDAVRREEAMKKMQELNDSFSKETEKALAVKMDNFEKNKQQKLDAIQDKLKEHATRLQAVRLRADCKEEEMKKQAQAKLNQKMTDMEKNRALQLKAIQAKIKEHEKHITEVIETAKGYSDDRISKAQEKHLNKMMTTINNREDQLKGLMEKLQLHERHVKDVQSKKGQANESMDNSIN